jgi:hypothetical protein
MGQRGKWEMKKGMVVLFLAAWLFFIIGAIGCSTEENKKESSTNIPAGSFRDGSNEDWGPETEAWSCDDSLKVFSYLEKVHLNGERIKSEKWLLAREALAKILDKRRIPVPLISVSENRVSYINFILSESRRQKHFLDQIEDEKKYCRTVEQIASEIEVDGVPPLTPPLTKEELLRLIHKGILRYFIASLDPHSWTNEWIEFEARKRGIFFDADPDENVFRSPPNVEDNPVFNLPAEDSLRARFFGDENEILYIELLRFDETSSGSFKKGYETFVPLSDKRKGLIIDLRRNSGGKVEAVAELSDLFLKEGPTLTMREKKDENEWENHIRYARKGNEPDGIDRLPIIILISRFSASASEIFASIMKDYHAAVIIGERSFGKGTGQIRGPLTAFPLGMKSRSVLSVTTDYTYSPSGKPLQLEGVEPDIYVYDHDYRDCLEKCPPGIYRSHERWIDSSSCCEEAFFNAHYERNLRNAVPVPSPLLTSFKEPPMNSWWNYNDLKQKLEKYFSDLKGEFKFSSLIDFFETAF